MAGKKLDRKRPFGEISGNISGAVFEQDGILFDGEGDELGQEAPAAKAVAPAANGNKANGNGGNKANGNKANGNGGKKVVEGSAHATAANPPAAGDDVQSALNE